MKALSLLQPWASLVVLGHKQIETRSWNTKYRGPLLIHASKGKTKVAERLWIKALQTYGVKPANDKYHFTELPFGAIIGSVELLDVFTTDYIMREWENSEGYLSFRNEADPNSTIHHYAGNIENEHAFGDYSEGRYGWLLSNPVLFKEPIPCKGSLGLWTPDLETIEMISKQIELLIP